MEDEYNGNPWLKAAKESNAYAKNMVKTTISDEEDFMKSSAGMYAREAAARRAYMLAARRRRADVKDDEGDHRDNEYSHIAEDGDKVYIRDDRDKSEHKFDSWADAMAWLSGLKGDTKALENDLDKETAQARRRMMARRMMAARRNASSYRTVDHTRLARMRRMH
jgi:hypothetical protein